MSSKKARDLSLPRHVPPRSDVLQKEVEIERMRKGEAENRREAENILELFLFYNSYWKRLKKKKKGIAQKALVTSLH